MRHRKLVRHRCRQARAARGLAGAAGVVRSNGSAGAERGVGAQAIDPRPHVGNFDIKARLEFGTRRGDALL
jgi:hypothetical protein